MVMSGIRRERSRSPTRGDISGRRRDKLHELNKNTEISNVMNQMMMSNIYTPGNMLMTGGMYGNMMMPNPLLPGPMMQPTPMEMIPGSGMEIMPPPPMDIPVIGPQGLGAQSAPSMDISVMGGVMMDHPMLAMYSNMNTEMVQEKKEIVFKHCKLTPPNPGTPQPPLRERPVGCRTIFVGGLPDKMRESVVREIFEPYGRIQVLRLSKKNFCHIRFDRESCVEAAMAITGYKIKLINREKDEKDKEKDDEDTHATSGWLHVDYALSRDDQSEYDRRQRQALRAQHAQMQQLNMQQDNGRKMIYRRSPSPIRIQPFTNTAVVQLCEKIKSEEHFGQSLPTLIAWLERGDCSKKYSNHFYSMIQVTNTHIRRLFGEKMQAEEELQQCKERVKNQIQNIIEQLEQVAKVFTAATHQRVWDHFTKPQRKNIETWQKMAQDFANLKEEFNEKFQIEEMDYNGTFENKTTDFANQEVALLKRQNESLQFQLEAYKNEIAVVKSESHKEVEKLRTQLLSSQTSQSAMDCKELKMATLAMFVSQPPLPLAAPILKPPPPPPLPDDVDAKVNLNDSVGVGCGEAKLIGVMSAFLQVHPQGASLDYVVSYVRGLFPHISQAMIHQVLQKHEDVFQRTTSGVGVNIENRWTFVAFSKRT